MEQHPPITTAEQAEALRHRIRHADPELRDDLMWAQQRLWEWENAHSSPYPVAGDTVGWEHFNERD